MRRYALLLFALSVLSISAVGCRSSGSDPGGVAGVGEMPPELVDALISSVGTSDGSGGFRSPTAEPGMEMAHAAGIAAGSLLASQAPDVVAYAETDAGAAVLLLVVNRASCPICKGILSAGGWRLVQTGAVEEDGVSYPTYGLRHRDGREIGLESEASTAIEKGGAGAGDTPGLEPALAASG